jgi:uncharacterized protein YkwD
MQAIRLYQFTAVLVGFVLMATICNASPGQGETTGAWHHFGDVATAAPNDSGVWHHFGDANIVPRTSLPGTVRRPRTASVGSLEMEMLEAINRARLDPANSDETGGRALPLKWNASLAAVAREHSRDMLMRGYFGHTDREGRSAGMRVKAAGIAWQATAENIAEFDRVSGAETAFMSEPRFAHNHRANILNPKYTEVGIGIVQDRTGRYYITQEFIEAPTDMRAAFPE